MAGMPPGMPGMPPGMPGGHKGMAPPPGAMPPQHQHHQQHPQQPQPPTANAGMPPPQPQAAGAPGAPPPQQLPPGGPAAMPGMPPGRPGMPGAPPAAAAAAPAPGMPRPAGPPGVGQMPSTQPPAAVRPGGPPAGPPGMPQQQPQPGAGAAPRGPGGAPAGPPGMPQQRPPGAAQPPAAAMPGAPRPMPVPGAQAPPGMPTGPPGAGPPPGMRPPGAAPPGMPAGPPAGMPQQQQPPANMPGAPRTGPPGVQAPPGVPTGPPGAGPPPGMQRPQGPPAGAGGPPAGPPGMPQQQQQPPAGMPGAPRPTAAPGVQAPPGMPTGPPGAGPPPGMRPPGAGAPAPGAAPPGMPAGPPAGMPARPPAGAGGPPTGPAGMPQRPAQPPANMPGAPKTGPPGVQAPPGVPTGPPGAGPPPGMPAPGVGGPPPGMRPPGAAGPPPGMPPAAGPPGAMAGPKTAAPVGPPPAAGVPSTQPPGRPGMPPQGVAPGMPPHNAAGPPQEAPSQHGYAAGNGQQQYNQQQQQQQQQQQYNQQQYAQQAPEFVSLSLHKPGIGPNRSKVKCNEGFPRLETYSEPKSQVLKPHPYATELSDKYMRFTHGIIPSSQELMNKIGLPVGICLRPFAEPEGDENLPVIASTTGRGPTVVRCVKCRTYINPYCTFTDGGRMWVCSMCKVLNQAADYYCPLDQNGYRKDMMQHPELLHCMGEFLAPSDYIQRPPIRPTYVFVLDVSFGAEQSGFLRSACQAVKAAVGSIPGDPQIAVITYDHHVSVFNLNPKQKRARMITIPEMTSEKWVESTSFGENAHAAVESVQLPILSEDLIVPLAECHTLLDDLLDRIPTMFANTQHADCATGPAVVTALKILLDKGGKLSLFSAGLPSIGCGRLQNRDNAKLYGTATEHTLLKPPQDNVFFGKLGGVAAQEQVCVDVYLYKAKNYLDVSTVSTMSKMTTGNVHLYPRGMGPEQQEKMANETHEALKREAGFESVMRVRVSAGWKVRNMSGHFSFRTSDLMSVPNIDPSDTFVAELVPHHTAPMSKVCVQCAVLYTSANRERRLRVHTAMLEVDKNYSRVVASLDPLAIATCLSRKAIDLIPTSFETARSSLVEKNLVFLKEYRKELAAKNQRIGTQLFLPHATRLLPLYTLALLKSTLFRVDKTLTPDARAHAIRKVTIMSPENLEKFMLPMITPLHLLESEGELHVPNTMEALQREGIYLMDDTERFVIWVGKLCPPAYVSQFISQETKAPVRIPECRINQLFWEIIDRERNVNREVAWQTFAVVYEGTPEAEALFVPHLVEDDVCSVKSYGDMLLHLQQKINKE